MKTTQLFGPRLDSWCGSAAAARGTEGAVGRYGRIPPRALVFHGLVAALALVPSGCTGRDVVAKVGGTAITRAELDSFMDATGDRYADDPGAALEALVGRARLAEAARRDDVDEDPTTRARLAASRREILAGAYVDKMLEPSMREDALLDRYKIEKEKLTRRRIHVAHIVARPTAPGKDAREAAQARITRAYARLAGGEPFEAVAKAMSDDGITAARGGDLGPLREGQVDAAFFDQAAALKLGETSRPFESSFGFHIVKALEEPRVDVQTFEEARGSLAAEARREAELELDARLRREISAKLYLDRVERRTASAARRPGAGRGR